MKAFQLAAVAMVLLIGVSQAAFETCKFNFGKGWNGGSDLTNVDFVSAYAGNNGAWDNNIGNMVLAAHNAGVTPMLYGYLTAFSARTLGGLQDCDVGEPSLCTQGTQYIRDHWNDLIALYSLYAQNVANITGASGQSIWLIEPDLYQYSEMGSQQRAAWLGSSAAQLNGGLPNDSIVMFYDAIVSAIKSELPNALVSLDISPWINDPASWYGAFSSSDYDFVATSGGRTEADNALIRSENQMTWSQIHQLTGKPVLADCGYGVGGGSTGHDAAWDLEANIRARHADGVISINQYNAAATWNADLVGIRSQIADLDLCAGGSSSSSEVSSSSEEPSSSSSEVSSSSEEPSSSSSEVSSSSEAPSSSSVTELCGLFENGSETPYNGCYNAGLNDMNEGSCYALNPARGELSGWIGDNASDSWWWVEVSCDGESSSSSSEESSSSAGSESPCVAFVNGAATSYAGQCFNSGLNNMELETCYALNPERGDQSGWIGDNASDSWWWLVVPCVVEQSSSSSEESSSSVEPSSSSSEESSSSVEPSSSSEGDNLIVNGDFASPDLSDWLGWASRSGTGVVAMSVDSGELKYDIVETSAYSWDIQLIQAGLSLDAGKTYRLSYTAYASSDTGTITTIIGSKIAPYARFGYEEITLSDTPTEYGFEFTMSISTDLARLVINAGNFGVGQIYFDDFSLVEVGGSSSSSEPSSSSSVIDNLIENGDFASADLNDWSGWASKSGTGVISMSVVSEELEYDIIETSAYPWDIQLIQAGLSLEAGKTYRLSYTAYASSDTGTITTIIGSKIAPYARFGYEEITLSDTPTEYGFEFTMDTSTSLARLVMNLGNFGVGQLYFDDFSLVEVDAIPSFSNAPILYAEKVNGLGGGVHSDGRTANLMDVQTVYQASLIQRDGQQFSLGQIPDGASVMIVDHLGRQVLKQTVQGGALQIDASSLPSGLLIVRAHLGSWQSAKVIRNF